MGVVIEKKQCPNCVKTGGDLSKDNLISYPDGDWCFACAQGSSKDLSTSVGTSRFEDITERGISKQTCEKLGIKVGVYSGTLGRDTQAIPDRPVYLFNRYEGNKIVAQKIRDQKDSHKAIQAGNTKLQKLFGQHAFSPTKKLPVIVTEGEFDAAAIYEMTQYPVVSIPNGSGGAVKSLVSNLEWLQQWSHVILCFDSDEAGQEAIKNSIPIFEPGSVRVVNLPVNDANDLLMAGRQGEMKMLLFNAEVIKPSTIVTLKEIQQRILTPPEVGIPWPWKKMTEVTYGCRPHEMYVVAAAEGIGKTEFIKELIFHMSDQGTKVGIFSFEQKADDTARRLIGSKLNKRLHIPGEANWSDDEILEHIDKLDDLIYLYDNNGALPIETIIINIRYMVKCFGVKMVIIDNLTALCANAIVDGKRMVESSYVGYVMNKLSSLVKELDVTMIVASHLATDKIGLNAYVTTSPKNPDSYFNITAKGMDKYINKPGMHWESGRVPKLESIYGSGIVRFVADYILVLARNRVSDDEEERRTTRVKFLKTRLDSALEGIQSEFELTYDYKTGRLNEK